GGQRDRVPVASEPSVHPENVDDRLLLRHRMPPFGWLPARAGWRSGGELDRASRHLWVGRVRSRDAQQIVGGGRPACPPPPPTHRHPAPPPHAAFSFFFPPRRPPKKKKKSRR